MVSEAAAVLQTNAHDYAHLRLSVVHVVDNMRLGGTELNVIKLSRALKERGVPVRVVLTGDWGPLAEQYREAEIQVERVPVGPFTSPKLLSQLRQLSRAVHEPPPTVVHSHDRYSNLATGLMPRTVRSRPRYVVSHRSGLPTSLAWRLALRFAFCRSDLVTANGTVAGEIARRLMSRNRPLVIVPNFLEDWCFGEGSPAEYSRRNDGRGNTVVELGFVGRLEPVKRVERLLDMAHTLMTRDVPFRLSIVGDGSERAHLMAKADYLGLSPCVRFLGEQPRRPLPQLAFDVLLLCSSSEGTPNAIVEAMACGVPVVATDVGGVSGVVEHGTTGLLVAPDDQDGLVTAVTQLILDESMRKALGSASRDRALRDWREEAVIARLVREVYCNPSERLPSE